MIKPSLTILALIVSRIIISIKSFIIRIIYLLKGSTIGNNFKVVGNIKIRGWYSNVVIEGDVDLHNNCCLIAGRNGYIKIGHRSSISYNTIINAGAGKIFIGANTMISGNCYIVSNDHDIHTTLSVRDAGHIIKDIYIGNNVWIGANVVITKGVHIGNGTIIGAGSVVTKSIPPMVVAAGNPCKVIFNRRLISNE